MSDFKASNGITVTTLPDGQVGFTRPVPGTPFEQRAEWLTPAEARAFEEAVTVRMIARRLAEHGRLGNDNG